MRHAEIFPAGPVFGYDVAQVGWQDHPQTFARGDVEDAEAFFGLRRGEVGATLREFPIGDAE